VLVDAETAPLIKTAISKLDWPVQLLSVGDEVVQDATSFAQLLQDDGAGKINKKKYIGHTKTEIVKVKLIDYYLTI
jgi:hypothetical protein